MKKQETKFGQNSHGNYRGYLFNSTMTKLTVYRAPVWVRNSKGFWVEAGTRDITVGVNSSKDFDLEEMFNIAVNPPTEEIIANIA